MKVNFTDFNRNTPTKDRYEYVIDYISHDFDLEFEDAFYLIKQLKHNRSSVVIYGESIVDFNIYDDFLHVEIDGDGFWFAENIDLEIAKEVLRKAYEGCKYFGKYLPNTTREWESWTG
jgi:hypothetical protein